MHVAWTKHVVNNPEAKQNLEKAIYNSQEVLDRLYQLVEEKESLIDRTEHTVADYEAAGWAYKQAHLNGRRAELRDIKNLLKI